MVSIAMDSPMFNPLGRLDGHWVVACEGTKSRAFGVQLMDTSGGGGLTRTASLFASVFVRDAESREYLPDGTPVHVQPKQTPPSRVRDAATRIASPKRSPPHTKTRMNPRKRRRSAGTDSSQTSFP